jgi:hypothetical protein
LLIARYRQANSYARFIGAEEGLALRRSALGRAQVLHTDWSIAARLWSFDTLAAQATRLLD